MFNTVAILFVNLDKQFRPTFGPSNAHSYNIIIKSSPLFSGKTIFEISGNYNTLLASHVEFLIRSALNILTLQSTTESPN